MEKKKYLSSVTLIRGIAAAAVALFHFTKGFVAEMTGMQFVMPYAWLGVEVFFVISGFVIPYALIGTSFKINNYGGYLLKRLVRIEPAYIVSIALVLILNYLSTLAPIYQGPPFNVDPWNILHHLGYLVEFFDGTWLNPVYWTLAIEFQYYLVIGVLVALWNLNNKPLIIISILAFIGMSFIDQEITRFFKFTDIFAMGIVCAFYKRKYLTNTQFMPIIFLVTCIVFYNHRYVISILCVVATLGIAYINRVNNFKLLIFLGNISYSLYLLHIPVGGRLVNLFRRLSLNNFEKGLGILVAFAFSIFAAWLFYHFIEKPSHRWSRKIKLKLNKT